MPYSCAQCGLLVLMIDGKPVRGCGCDAAVIADMRATTGGAGGVRQR